MRASLRMLVSMLVSAISLSCAADSGTAPTGPVASLAIEPTNAVIQVGTSAHLSAIPQDSSGDILSGRVTTWTSSNIAVATVTQSGMVSGVALGSAKVTATVEGKSDSAGVTVTSAPPGASNLIEKMDPIDAGVPRGGLGFNVAADQLWQFAMAKALGATEVRMQFDWPSVERTPGAFALTPTQAAALDECARLGLQPLLVAAYGPGWVDLGVFTLESGAAIGSLTLKFNEDISTVEPYFGQVVRTNGTSFISSQYASLVGATIKAVNPLTKTITLAAPTVNTLTAGTQLILRRRHYRAPGTVTGITDSNGAIARYTAYVQFLANQISGRGLTGRVEIWNEPPFVGDRWDGGEACFIADANWGANCKARQYGFARALLSVDPPAGVRWEWGGTNLTGFASVIGNEIGVTPTRMQVENRLAYESFHPYGQFPEAHAYDPVKLRAANINSDIYTSTSLVGVNTNSNFKYGRKLAMNNIASAGWAVEQVISEHGYNSTNRVSQARHMLRSYLTYLSLGWKRINFYRLASASDGYSYEIVNSTTRAPYQAYDALQSFMADLDAIGTSPPPATLVLPTVTAYSGTWPLMTVPIRGSSGVLVAVWQRTYSLVGERFDAFASPAPGTVELEVPVGLRVVGAWSLTDRVAVPVSSPTQDRAVVQVRDDPVVVRLDLR